MLSSKLYHSTQYNNEISRTIFNAKKTHFSNLYASLYNAIPRGIPSSRYFFLTIARLYRPLRTHYYISYFSRNIKIYIRMYQFCYFASLFSVRFLVVHWRVCDSSAVFRRRNSSHFCGFEWKFSTWNYEGSRLKRWRKKGRERLSRASNFAFSGRFTVTVLFHLNMKRCRGSSSNIG